MSVANRTELTQLHEKLKETVPPSDSNEKSMSTTLDETRFPPPSPLGRVISFSSSLNDWWLW